MLIPIDLTIEQETSPLGRTSPLVKLGLAVVWLVGLALMQGPTRPLVLAVVAIAAGLTLGRIPPVRLIGSLVPLGGAAISIALANLLFASANAEAGAHDLLNVGLVRITSEAAAAAAALGARVIAIVATGVVFAQTTDPTRLMDALVQQAHVSDRFAYGALAAYQAVPRLGEDLSTLRQARRVRGLAREWHPRLFLGLLIRAIRHADQLALAMDARAFGTGPRTAFRPIQWQWTDLVVGIGGLAILTILLIR